MQEIIYRKASGMTRGEARFGPLL